MAERRKGLPARVASAAAGFDLALVRQAEAGNITAPGADGQAGQLPGAEAQIVVYKDG